MDDREILQQILLELKGLREGQKSLEARQSNLEADFAEVKAGFAEVKAGFAEVKADVTAANGRLDRIEEDTRHTRVLVENDVRRDIQIIAEQHGDIIEKLSCVEEVDSLKGRVSTLESVTRIHSGEIANLKKAQ